MGPGGRGGGVGGEGRGCSIPKPLRNKIPTHSATVWQDRRDFLEMAGWGVVLDPVPHPLPSFEAWRFICAGLSLCQEVAWGKDGVIHPQIATGKPSCSRASCSRAACSIAAPSCSSPAAKLGSSSWCLASVFFAATSVQVLSVLLSWWMRGPHVLEGPLRGLLPLPPRKRPCGSIRSWPLRFIPLPTYIEDLVST